MLHPEPIKGYEIRKDIDNPNSYLFVTDHLIVYQVYFKYSPNYFFKDSTYSHYVYEFVIAVLENPTESLPIFDKKTSITIANIFEEFCQNVQEAIIVYICDSSDGRQMIRHRKFNAWFNEYNIDKFTKQDCILKESNGASNPMSLIIKKEHLFSYQIMEEFKITIDGYNSGK
jgi:hypothetical protein